MESKIATQNDLDKRLVSKEQIRNIKIGVAIGSGGVYAAAGIGVLEKLEQDGLNIAYVGGASGGSIISALYFLEGSAISAEQKFLQKLPLINKIKLSPFGKPMPGDLVRKTVENILDGRNWKDGKLKGVCFGAAFHDTKEPLILTKDTGISLVDSVLASISLKMIEPIIKLDGRIIAHGGDPNYIGGLKSIGADFVIEISPNINNGIIGKVAQATNTISSAFILKGDYLTSQKDNIQEKADYSIHPNLSLRPFISPLNFSLRNANFMIEKGRSLTEQVMPNLKEVLFKQR